MLLIPQAELAQSTAPFADLLGRYTGEGSGRWLAAFVVVSGIGCLYGWTLLVGELTCSMARRDGLPASSDLVVLGVLGTAYSIFAFVGLGREPFFSALALAAVGLPVFLWLRRRAR